MILSANCLESLEIFRNQTDHRENGSLLWVLDQYVPNRAGNFFLRANMANAAARLKVDAACSENG